jgi:hypothetical protein
MTPVMKAFAAGTAAHIGSITSVTLRYLSAFGDLAVVTGWESKDYREETGCAQSPKAT